MSVKHWIYMYSCIIRLFFLGDFNIEIEDASLCSFMSSFDLKSLIKEPTCFKSLNNPSCIDPKSFMHSQKVTNCISDFRKLTIYVFKTTFAKAEPREIMYRSYKTDKFRSFYRNSH